MSLVTRQAMSDDSGIFTDGTIVNKAFVDQVYDQIDDQTHSTTNPTIKPKAITDEVVAARGSKATLDARLDVALEEDGTPKAVAGQATETQLARAEANFNLIRNSDLEDWTAGTTSAPDNYSLDGVGAAILKSGPAEADTTDLGTGTYCARITSGAGAAAKLTQEVISTADYSKYRSVDGRKVGFTIRAKVANSNVLRIVVDDGVTTTVGSYATGSVNEQDISVVHTISASATKLDVYAEVALGAGVAYVGGFTAVFSDLAPAAWNPLWAKFRQDILDEAEPETGVANGITVKIGGVINAQHNDAASSGTGETDAHSYTLPANALAADGDFIVFRGGGTSTNDANAKTVRFYFDGTSYTLGVSGTAFTSFAWEVWVIRISSTAALIVERPFFFDASSNNNGVTVTEDSSVNFAATIAIKTTLQFATAGTITEKFFTAELKPAP